jgi:hypothetical protein
MSLSKFILFFLLIAKTSLVWSQGKNVLFLDLNDGKKEIDVAKKATRKKGDKLKVYPDKQFKMEELKEILATTKYDSIVISGHNGGSDYSGSKGSVSVNELLQVLEETSNDKVRSLYLLGCNTANKSKIFFWKSALPQLKFIAGYDGTAPSSERPAGLEYFADTYAKEDQLIKTNVEATLKSSLQKINHIYNLEASIYVCDEEDKNQYIYLSQRPSKERFSPLSSRECLNKLTEFKDNYLSKIRQYWSGELEPTTEDTTNGFLRKAYVFSRQNEHCLINEGEEMFEGISGDSLLLLLFNKAFNENFAAYYSPLITEALTEIEEIETKEEEYLQKRVREAKNHLKLLDEIKKSPEKYQELVNQEMSHLDREMQRLLSSNARMRSCISNMNNSCLSLAGNIEAYYKLEDRKSSWENFQTSVNYKQASLRSADYIAEDIKYFKSNELNRVKSLLSKMKNHPEQFSRKDLMDLDHQLMNSPSLLRSVSKLSGPVNSAVDMQAFPFSWHEKSLNNNIEDPQWDTLEEIRTPNVGPVNTPGLQEIANIVYN